MAQAMVPSGPRAARTTVVVELTDMSDNFSGRLTAFGCFGAALENSEARARMEGALRPLMMLLRSGNLGTAFESESGRVPYARTCPLNGSVARTPAGSNGAIESQTTVSLTLGAAVPTYPDSMCRAAWNLVKVYWLSCVCLECGFCANQLCAGIANSLSAEMRSNSEAAATRAAAVRAAADAAVASGSSVLPRATYSADIRGPDPFDAPPSFVNAHTLMRTLSMACDRFCAEGAAVAASKLLMAIDLTSGVRVCVRARACVCA